MVQMMMQMMMQMQFQMMQMMVQMQFQVQLSFSSLQLQLRAGTGSSKKAWVQRECMHRSTACIVECQTAAPRPSRSLAEMSAQTA